MRAPRLLELRAERAYRRRRRRVSDVGASGGGGFGHRFLGRALRPGGRRTTGQPQPRLPKGRPTPRTPCNHHTAVATGSGLTGGGRRRTSRIWIRPSGTRSSRRTGGTPQWSGGRRCETGIGPPGKVQRTTGSRSRAAWCCASPPTACTRSCASTGTSDSGSRRILRKVGEGRPAMRSCHTRGPNFVSFKKL